MNETNKVYGCAPFYFLGAAIFLVIGGVLFFLKHPIIGAIIMTPGVALLVLALLTSLICFQIKRSDEVNIVIRDSESDNQYKKLKQTKTTRKKHKRKKFE